MTEIRSSQLQSAIGQDKLEQLRKKQQVKVDNIDFDGDNKPDPASMQLDRENKLVITFKSSSSDGADKMAKVDFVDEEVPNTNRGANSNRGSTGNIDITPIKWQGYTQENKLEFKNVFGVNATDKQVPYISNNDPRAKQICSLFGVSSVSELQKLVGAKVDNKLGPETFFAIKEYLAAQLVNANSLESGSKILGIFNKFNNIVPDIINKDGRLKILKMYTEMTITNLINQKLFDSSILNDVNTLKELKANGFDVETPINNFINSNISRANSLEQIKLFANLGNTLNANGLNINVDKGILANKIIDIYNTKISSLDKKEDIESIKSEILNLPNELISLGFKPEEAATILEQLNKLLQAKENILTPQESNPVEEPKPQDTKPMPDNVKNLLSKLEPLKYEKMLTEEAKAKLEKEFAKGIKSLTNEDMDWIVESKDPNVNELKNKIFKMVSYGDYLLQRPDLKMQENIIRLAMKAGEYGALDKLFNAANKWWPGGNKSDDLARKLIGEILSDPNKGIKELAAMPIEIRTSFMKALEADSSQKENKEMALLLLQTAANKEEFCKLAVKFGIEDADDLKKLVDKVAKDGNPPELFPLLFNSKPPFDPFQFIGKYSKVAK